MSPFADGPNGFRDQPLDRSPLRCQSTSGTRSSAAFNRGHAVRHCLGNRNVHLHAAAKHDAGNCRAGAPWYPFVFSFVLGFAIGCVGPHIYRRSRGKSSEADVGISQFAPNSHSSLVSVAYAHRDLPRLDERCWARFRAGAFVGQDAIRRGSAWSSTELVRGLGRPER
jgi:hypothetical protein